MRAQRRRCLAVGNTRPQSFRNSKIQIPNPATTDARPFGIWTLARDGLLLSRRRPIAAGIVDARSCRSRREVVERFGVDALRAGDAIEFGKRGIVAEQRLQTYRPRSGRLH